MRHQSPDNLVRTIRVVHSSNLNQTSRTLQIPRQRPHLRPMLLKPLPNQCLIGEFIGQRSRSVRESSIHNARVLRACPRRRRGEEHAHVAPSDSLLKLDGAFHRPGKAVDEKPARAPGHLVAKFTLQHCHDCGWRHWRLALVILCSGSSICGGLGATPLGFSSRSQLPVLRWYSEKSVARRAMKVSLSVEGFLRTLSAMHITRTSWKERISDQ
jgi:hypothetical protein